MLGRQPRHEERNHPHMRRNGGVVEKCFPLVGEGAEERVQDVLGAGVEGRLLRGYGVHHERPRFPRRLQRGVRHNDNGERIWLRGALPERPFPPALLFAGASPFSPASSLWPLIPPSPAFPPHWQTASAEWLGDVLKATSVDLSDLILAVAVNASFMQFLETSRAAAAAREPLLLPSWDGPILFCEPYPGVAFYRCPPCTDKGRLALHRRDLFKKPLNPTRLRPSRMDGVQCRPLEPRKNSSENRLGARAIRRGRSSTSSPLLPSGRATLSAFPEFHEVDRVNVSSFSSSTDRRGSNAAR